MIKLRGIYAQNVNAKDCCHTNQAALIRNISVAEFKDWLRDTNVRRAENTKRENILNLTACNINPMDVFNYALYTVDEDVTMTTAISVLKSLHENNEECQYYIDNAGNLKAIVK